MRGGAIPLIAWGVLNLVLLIIAGIWEGDGIYNGGIHMGLAGYTVLAMWLGGLVLLLQRRHAIHKGPPEYERDIDALPRVSFGAAGFGIACALAGFGIVFGKFLIYIGGALLIASVGQVVRELRWQRRTMDSVRREHRL
jgi:uncharacterized iron-regulated membrane protein